MATQLQYPHEPIAVIGSACRFPGEASSPSALWDLLRNPRDVQTKIPDNRFNADKFYHPDHKHHGATNVRHAYILSEDPRAFDAHFFGVKPIEANAIDPQQRLLLESAYEALEAAGLPMEMVQGTNMGVFVGMMTEDYSNIVARDLNNVPTYFASGTARSIISNRVSYVFDLHGPSMTIDTACSSSLVALHQAVQSLRGGESCAAIVAGSNLILSPEQYLAGSKIKLFSPSGRSRMWDKDADGYARGEGVGVIVVKTLSQALADGDSIECIVRETGVNQDGHTKGITMPSSVAQANLVRATYAKAGLDLSRPSDRPQYFEAHGTGTAAGDPIEAEAISSVFFNSIPGYSRSPKDHPLYVGSIKTVLGHAEGSAGVAGVLKASLAIQNGILPPNLLLNELSPTVRPFYDDLRILQEAQDWPEVPHGTPRRASINSFGFGGTNSHAILEQFMPPEWKSTTEDTQMTPITHPLAPFNFSAATEKTLLVNLACYASFLREHRDISLRDLSWTLNSRRSTLSSRLSIPALTIADLIARLEHASQTSDDIVNACLSASSPRILGIFTGQGAQWATMGSHLIRSSSILAKRLQTLQYSLDTLPAEHIPAWSLRDELLKPPETSRIGEGELSQPLCTSVQILLVDLLQAAGVELAAVVGHSSGEIGGAYAAGYLSAEDAIRIAYYRGLFLTRAGKHDGPQGAMLAVGTTHEDAQELVELPLLNERICIAAKNSPTSLTLSGDLDAVQDAKEILEDEKKFARLLKVDKAYHSHHMTPCANPYIEALKKCGIQARTPPSGGPVWISSVLGKQIEALEMACLESTYWADNMVKPVLFSQAVEYAVGTSGPFDMAIEIGPHPALKGPASETIQNIYGSSIPYIGTLCRGKNDIESFTTALGSLWRTLGQSAVDFDALDKAVYGTSTPPAQLLKGLPRYSWDHDKTYWHEMRAGKSFRVKGDRPHPLIGSICPDETEKEFRFKNYLSPREIPWLQSHKIQDQMVFPAAGYVSCVIEAVAKLYRPELVQLVELTDVSIEKALVFQEDSKVETMLSLVLRSNTRERSEFLFTYYSDSDKDSTIMAENASGTVLVIRGTPSQHSLPSPCVPTGAFVDLEPSRFYKFAWELGLQYEDVFEAMTETRRKVNESTGFLRLPIYGDDETPLIIHPGTLDSSLQAILMAYSFPGDGRLRCPYLPTRIDRIRMDLMACQSATHKSAKRLPFYASVDQTESLDIVGDVEFWSETGDRVILQLQGLHGTPLTPPSAANDAKLFFDMSWGPKDPTGAVVDWQEDKFADIRALSFSLERVAYFYLRKLGATFPHDKRHGLEWYHNRLLDYVDHCLKWVGNGTHPYVQKDWSNDSVTEIDSILEENHDSIDLRLMKAIGDGIFPAIRGESNILEVMTKDRMLDSFYSRAIGMSTYLEDMGRLATQISHRFGHMNILEIGAGIGAATATILEQLNGAFASYTYTDISSGFFQKAKDKFQEHQSKMLFNVFDVEKLPVDQGFTEGSYDLVVASLVLHATHNLEETLTNARRLLRPGGYLIMLEITDNDPLRLGFIFGGLSGWWLGDDEDRKLSPCVSTQRWESLLTTTGFSGISAITPHNSTFPVPLSTIVSQAVDDRVNFLREPLAPGIEPLNLGSLTIIGDAQKAWCLHAVLSRHYSNVQCLSSLAEVASVELPFLGSVLSLVDLEDTHAFENISETELKAVQEIFKQSKSVLWATVGAHGQHPYRNMIIGIQRAISLEMAHVRTQVLDFSSPADVGFEIIARNLLQLEATGMWDQTSQLDDLLWTVEPEVIVKNNHALIPRFRLGESRNNRYNSTRRLVTHNADGDDGSLVITRDGPQLRLEQVSKPSVPSGTVRITHSLLNSVEIVGMGNAYIALGVLPDSEEHVFVLTNTQTSHVPISSSVVVPTFYAPGEALGGLVSLYTELVAQVIMKGAVHGMSVVVFNPSQLLGDALYKLADERDVRLLLLTTSTAMNGGRWNCIHERSTRKSLLRILPTEVSLFVDMDGDDQMSAIIRNCLQPTCQRFSCADLLAGHLQFDFNSDNITRASEYLKEALSRSSAADTHTTNSYWIPSLALSDINQDSTAEFFSQTILLWETQGPVSVPIKPASTRVAFRPDKTYWLVGLKGGLGLSMCQWMVEHGARNVAISSRNPDIDRNWLQAMADIGCVVRTFENDVTSRESVREVYESITQTMPPIAGVAQGAMVLRDTPFPDLDLERFEKVTKPKINGSIFLDEIFSEPTLDFFVFFSSIAYVAGNAGQSAYAAANGFMASLAANRRSRGLAGSVINIGAIVGNGYISRELTPEKQMALLRAGYSFLSEQDFIEVVAEGILASHPDSLGSIDVSAGLRLEEDDYKGIKWAANPIFQHLIPSSSDLVSVDSRGGSSAPMKAQLLEADTTEQVFEILKAGFISKLRAVLQVDTEQPIMRFSPDDLGVDSLIAVDIQSWFRKELGIDMPVLKLLNSPSIHDLLCSAQDLLAPEVVPGLMDQDSATMPVSSPSATNPELQGSSTSKSPQVSQASTFSAPSTASPGTSTPSSAAQTDDTRLSEFESNIQEILSNKLGIINVPPNEHPLFERSVPMSFAQSRFWFLKFFAEDQTAFNITSCVRLDGNIDIHKLDAALQSVSQRHEALRTVFYTDKATKQHMQGILPNPALRVEYDLVTNEEQVKHAIKEIQEHSYDLSQGISLRLKLLSLSSTSHVLVLGYHHIALDGIGFQIFFSDLEKAYHGKLDLSGSDVMQYADYSIKQRNEYKEGRWSQELGYWRGHFSDIPPALPLLALSQQISRPAAASFSSFTVEFRLDNRLKSEIQQASRRFKTNPFHFYSTAFAVLLFRHSSNVAKDLCIGLTDGNRKDSEVLQSLGVFVNVIPLRVRQNIDQSFADLLKDVKSRSDLAYANSRIPFDVLLDELKVPRTTTHTPIFQALLNYRQNIQEARAFCGCEAKGELVSGGRNAYDISLDIVDSIGNENLVTISVNSDLYTQDDVEILKRSYLCLLQVFARNPASKISWPALHLEEDSATAISLGRGPECSSQWPETIVDRIDDMVKEFGERVSLKNGLGESLTYREMGYRIGQLATELLGRGVRSGSLVGIFQNPGPQWIISLLATLRTGAACIPMDRQVGTERLLLMAKDSNAQVILVDKDTFAEKSFLISTGAMIFDTTNLSSWSQGGVVSSRAKLAKPAIIAYTSGSTGVPKGITLTHAGYKNFFEFAPARWGIREGQETILQQSSYAFDMSILQIFTCLAYGGTLVVPVAIQRSDPEALCELIVSEAVTFTLATPTEYLGWIGHGRTNSLRTSHWRGAMTGGEPLTRSLAEAFKALGRPDLRLVNCYGPAEATIGCADGHVDYMNEAASLVGLSTIPNYSVYIVDAELRPVPIGVTGQIAIGGAGVASGYLSKEQLSSSAFVTDKHASTYFRNHGWGTIHISGDRGKLTREGRLILQGRVEGSTQVKIGGIRIDLQDIENTILEATSPHILQAIVELREDRESGIPFLIAFVTLSQTNPPSHPDAFVAGLPQTLPLPQYMRPSFVSRLVEMPKTASGKIDRVAINALPILQSSGSPGSGHNPPLAKSETALLSLWQAVLPQEVAKQHRIGENSDFFHVGGNSLALVDLQSLIKDRFQVTIPLYRLFEATTLAQMATLLHEEEQSSTAGASTSGNNKGVETYSALTQPIMKLPLANIASTEIAGAETMEPTEKLPKTTSQFFDWEEEVQVSHDITNLKDGSADLRPTDYSGVVVLTGATGFLGKELVRQLIRSDSITEIHCIAVRKKKKELPEIFTHPKIFIHHGDLGAEQLGLSDDDVQAIFDKADTVIHNGADVSFMKSYQTLKLINVASTKELVRLSLPRRLPFHFISSATVARLSGQQAFGEMSVSDYRPSANIEDGYTSAKWVSEVYLECISDEFGLPVVVHRPSSITGEGAPESDLMSVAQEWSLPSWGTSLG